MRMKFVMMMALVAFVAGSVWAGCGTCPGDAKKEAAGAAADCKVMCKDMDPEACKAECAKAKAAGKAECAAKAEKKCCGSDECKAKCAAKKAACKKASDKEAKAACKAEAEAPATDTKAEAK